MSAIKQQQTSKAVALQFIPIDYIVRNPHQPRKHFDEDSLNDLADSIAIDGMLQPIVVRKLNPMKYELIAGERRWRAAGLAGVDTVPCIVKQCNDQQSLKLALIENIQREDLNALEEAEGIQRLISEFGFTHMEAAAGIGKSRTYVTNRMRILDLPEKVKVYLLMGQIEAGHANVLCGLPREWQLLKAEEIIKKKLTVRQFEAQVQKEFNRSNSRTASKSDPNVKALASRLSEITGCKTQIEQQGKGPGKLVVTFHSAEELEGYLRFFDTEKEH